MTGNFGKGWVNDTGPDLILETSYNRDNYKVRLLLSNNQYSFIRQVLSTSWTQLSKVQWTHAFTNCQTGSLNHDRWILPLDFDNDFSLSSTDTVIGIEITFLTTLGQPDMAGVYIINDTTCNSSIFKDSITICDMDTLTLDASRQNSTYLWHNDSTYSSFKTTKAGTYWVEVNTGVCLISDTVVVSKSIGPIVNLGNDSSLCFGDSLLLNVL